MTRPGSLSTSFSEEKLPPGDRERKEKEIVKNGEKRFKGLNAFSVLSPLSY